MNQHIKQFLVSTSAILMIAGVGASASNININAKRHHARTHRVYRHHRKSANWHYLHYHGNRKYRYSNSTTSLWRGIPSKEHWVLVKHNVLVKNISTEGTDDADAYPISTKILKKGSIIKGYYPPSSPSGFNILKSAKGFHFSKKYEFKHDASWIVFPRGNSYRGLYNNYWMKAVK